MIPAANEQERAIILKQWNAITASSGEGLLAHELLEFRATEAPEAIAIHHGETQVNYRELDQSANRLARYLQKQGVGPDVLVGIMLSRSPLLFGAVFGVLKAGGACLALDPATPPERIEFILKEAKTQFVLTDSLHAALLPAWVARLQLDQQTSSLIDLPPTAPSTPPLGPQNISRVFFTSGSQGVPKAVVWPHARQLPGRSWSETNFKVNRNDRYLLKSSPAFTPINLEIFQPIWVGASVFIAPPDLEFDLEAMARFIADKAITILNIVPSVLRGMLKTESFPKCNALRHVICFGEPLEPDLEQDFFRHSSAQLTVVYGATEAPSTTFRHCDPAHPVPGVNIGKHTGNKQVLILNEALDLAPIGATGEICTGGDHLAVGYLNDPILTAQKFIPNPFSSVPGERLYRTGDLGRYLPDGSLEFMGRLDSQVKIRGVRIELGEVESILRSQPDLGDVAVVDRETPNGEKVLVAYLEKTTPPMLESIRSFARERLPGAMMPSRFVLLDTLPRTSTGKLDRKALPDPFKGPRTAEPANAPSSIEQLRIGTIWRELLELDSIDVQDNFFFVGGHSLLGAKLACRLSEEFNTEFTPAHLLEFSSIAQQANYFLTKTAFGENSSRCLLRIQAGAHDHSPLVFFPGGKGGDEELLAYAKFLKAIGETWPVYAFRARGINGVDAPHASVRTMAEDYIRELLALNGPYFLVGECIGGNIAFEMACQLRAVGASIAFLGLFDTAQASFPRMAAAIWNRISISSREAKAKIAGAVPKKRARVAKQQLKRLCGFISDQFGWLGPNSSPEDLKARNLHKWRVRNLYPTAMMRFRPRPYPGDVHFFASEEGVQLRLADEWKPLVKGALYQHRLPGDHANYIFTNSSEVAKRLEELLNEAHALVQTKDQQSCSSHSPTLWEVGSPLAE